MSQCHPLTTKRELASERCQRADNTAAKAYEIPRKMYLKKKTQQKTDISNNRKACKAKQATYKELWSCKGGPKKLSELSVYGKRAWKVLLSDDHSSRLTTFAFVQTASQLTNQVVPFWSIVQINIR